MREIFRSAKLTQLRVLTSAFVARFFENETTVGPTDMRQSFFWLVALLGTPGIFLPLFMFIRWAEVAQDRGVAALHVASLLDKTIYLSLSFVGIGLVSALIWHALLMDRRDGLVLGGLPVSLQTLYSGKLLALGTYVALLSIGMHGPAAVFFGLGLGSPENAGAVARNMAAMFTAASGLNLFVLVVVAGSQSVTLAIAGSNLFARISPILHIAVVAATTLALVALPSAARGALSLAHPTPDSAQWLLWFPPIWFLGVYEQIAGDPVPAATMLAGRAAAALTIALGVLLASYPLASRRALDAAVQGTGTTGGRWRRSAGAVLTNLLARRQDERASIHLVLATLTRRHQHRLMTSVALGLGLAMTVPIAATYLVDGLSLPDHPVTALLAAPLLVMFVLVVGLRLTMAVPSELPAAWIFPVAPSPMFTGRNAARRLMIALGVGTPLLIAAPLWLFLWGPAVAMVHLAACALAGFTLVDTLLWGFVGMPCAKSMAPERANLQARWPLFAGGLYLFAYQFPASQIDIIYSYGPLLVLGPLVFLWGIVSRGSLEAAYANGVSGDPHSLVSLNLTIVPPARSPVPKERHA